MTPLLHHLIDLALGAAATLASIATLTLIVLWIWGGKKERQ